MAPETQLVVWLMNDQLALKFCMPALSEFNMYLFSRRSVTTLAERQR